jgi:hypothetical protein
VLDLSNLVGISAGIIPPTPNQSGLECFEFNGSQFIVYPQYPSMSTTSTYLGSLDLAKSTQNGPTSVNVNTATPSTSSIGTLNVYASSPTNTTPIQEIWLQTEPGVNNAGFSWNVSATQGDGGGVWTFKNYWRGFYRGDIKLNPSNPDLPPPQLGEFSL